MSCTLRVSTSVLLEKMMKFVKYNLKQSYIANKVSLPFSDVFAFLNATRRIKKAKEREKGSPWCSGLGTMVL